MPHIKGAINKNYRQNMEVIGNHNYLNNNRNGSGPRHLSTNVSNANLHGHNNSLGQYVNQSDVLGGGLQPRKDQVQIRHLKQKQELTPTIESYQGGGRYQNIQ